MFYKILAFLGILYEVLKCTLCLAQEYRRKGASLPKGWKQAGKQFFCSKCFDHLLSTSKPEVTNRGTA